MDGCVGVFVRDAEVIQAGTTVYSMPESLWNDTYDRWAEEYDIRFIFGEEYPRPEFYAVPRLDVFALDSRGGWIGTIGGTCDLQGEMLVAYVDREGRAFRIADSGPEFLERAPDWRSHLRPCEELRLFAFREAAEAELEFCAPPKMESITGE